MKTDTFVKWPEIQAFHNIRKSTHKYPELLGTCSIVTYKGKTKLHGTNSAVRCYRDGTVAAQSRTQTITPENDNAGFAKWVHESTLFNWQEIGRKFGNIVVFGESCFESCTPILLADGTKKTIGEIVNNKLSLDVLSYNLKTQKIEPKKIIGWSKRKDKNDDWINLTVKRRHRGGRGTRVVTTNNHVFYKSVNGVPCEIKASDLTVGDKLFVFEKQLSYYQKQFLIGSLLGDGSLSDHAIQVSHSEDFDGIIESEIVNITKGNPYKEEWRQYKYDITVEDNHNFFANNILVHNCGPGIQKGVAVNQIPNKSFCVFAVGFMDDEGKHIDDLIVESETIKHLVEGIENVYVLPWYNNGQTFVVDWSKPSEELESVVDSINAEVLKIEECDPWVFENFNVKGTGEGLVLYPVSSEHHGRKMFSDLGFKAKGEAHRVVKAAKPATIEPEVATNVDEFVKLVLTEARLIQGATAVSPNGNLEFNKPFIGKFLAWVCQDVMKETKSELEASDLTWDQVSKKVASEAKTWYLFKEMKG